MRYYLFTTSLTTGQPCYYNGWRFVELRNQAKIYETSFRAALVHASEVAGQIRQYVKVVEDENQ